MITQAIEIYVDYQNELLKQEDEEIHQMLIERGAIKQESEQ